MTQVYMDGIYIMKEKMACVTEALHHRELRRVILHSKSLAGRVRSPSSYLKQAHTGLMAWCIHCL